jgi:purine-nucleoside phosphorylase
MIEGFVTLQQIDQAADAVRKATSYRPQIAMILGSGLGDLADSISQADIIPFNEIPHWPKSTVQGHKGQLVIGKLQGHDVMIMQGRIHFYEGYSIQQVTMPIRVMQRLGVKTLIVTNAAGAVRPEFKPGDVMMITDHINLMGMTGQNPLIGPNIDELGERFPDMSQPYDRGLMDLARKAAERNQILLHEGIYVGLSGPSFESPADLRFLRAIGADAVGMSTIPETIVARHGNMKVLGFSGISNKANLDGSTVTTHEEVLQSGSLIVPKLKKIILDVLQSM